MRGVNQDNKATNKIFVLDAGQWKNYSEMPAARYSVTTVGY